MPFAYDVAEAAAVALLNQPEVDGVRAGVVVARGGGFMGVEPPDADRAADVVVTRRGTGPGLRFAVAFDRATYDVAPGALRTFLTVTLARLAARLPENQN